MPLFYSLIVGNIVDVSTIKSTLSELSGYRLDVSMVLMDAGYVSGDNIKLLLNNGIKCVTRLKANLTVYKEMIKKHIKTLREL
jgi:transposase